MFEKHLLEIKKLADAIKTKEYSEEKINAKLKVIAMQSGISFETIYKVFEEHIKNNKIYQ